MATGRLHQLQGRGLSFTFPINRRHQRMATNFYNAASKSAAMAAGFQSIGVTKEWRRRSALIALLNIGAGKVSNQ